jgi:hypothetical protein
VQAEDRTVYVDMANLDEVFQSSKNIQHFGRLFLSWQLKEHNGGQSLRTISISGDFNFGVLI